MELTDNPAFKRDQRGKDASVGDGGYNDRLTSPYVCPIAGLEMNGKFKFVVDWTKGKVRMLKNICCSSAIPVDFFH